MQSNVLSFSSSINRFDNLSVSEFNQLESESVIKLALEVVKYNFRPGEAFGDPGSARDYLNLMYMDQEQEIFSVLFLDNKHQLISHEELFFGTIDGASVYPREVVKTTLQHNAAALIFVHNHPSGNPGASSADKRITKRLKDALALIDVRVLDHIIVGKSGTVSFAEQGLL